MKVAAVFVCLTAWTILHTSIGECANLLVLYLELENFVDLEQIWP